MLDKQDIKLLKGMFEAHGKDTIVQLRDEMRAQMSASEYRLITRMDKLNTDLEKRLILRIDQVETSIGYFIDSAVLPQISHLDRRVKRIETRLKLV